MKQRVFFLNRLRPGVERSAYERWVREVDYPRARTIKAIVDYRVVRIDGALRGDDVPYDYIEVVEISDLSEYNRERERTPGRAEFVEQLRLYVGDVLALHGTLVE